tara:strand:- start:807 stop:1100 length:294 start_codon:yes stop_codon:yes gene_type:complete
MYIKDLEVGQLYKIKKNTCLDTWRFKGNRVHDYPVLRGWYGHKSSVLNEPPLIYLGYEHEAWVYWYRNTKKHHYVLWKGRKYLMDNGFARYLEAVSD